MFETRVDGACRFRREPGWLARPHLSANLLLVLSATLLFEIVPAGSVRRLVAGFSY